MTKEEMIEHLKSGKVYKITPDTMYEDKAILWQLTAEKLVTTKLQKGIVTVRWKD